MEHTKLFNSQLIKKAFYYAAEKHDGQYRKGTKVPFFVHPSLVALGVSEYTNEENTIAAAVLHDVVEDCGVSADELFNIFNSEISKIVKEISLLKTDELKKAKWTEKKKIYIELITNASSEALLIVAVDKMFNMKAYFDYAITGDVELLNELFGGTIENYLWYYEEIAKVLDIRLKVHTATKDYRKTLQNYTNKLRS